MILGKRTTCAQEQLTAMAGDFTMRLIYLSLKQTRGNRNHQKTSFFLIFLKHTHIMSFGPSLPSDEELIKKLRESALTREKAEEEILAGTATLSKKVRLRYY